MNPNPSLLTLLRRGATVKFNGTGYALRGCPAHGFIVLQKDVRSGTDSQLSTNDHQLGSVSQTRLNRDGLRRVMKDLSKLTGESVPDLLI